MIARIAKNACNFFFNISAPLLSCSEYLNLASAVNCSQLTFFLSYISRGKFLSGR